MFGWTKPYFHLGVQSHLHCRTTAPAAALANEDFIQSLAMYSLCLGQLVLSCRHLNGRVCHAGAKRVLCSTKTRASRPTVLQLSPSSSQSRNSFRGPFGTGWSSGCQTWSPGTLADKHFGRWTSGSLHRTGESKCGTRCTLYHGGSKWLHASTWPGPGVVI